MHLTCMALRRTITVLSWRRLMAREVTGRKRSRGRHSPSTTEAQALRTATLVKELESRTRSVRMSRRAALAPLRLLMR
jgi:hypothetical protein